MLAAFSAGSFPEGGVHQLAFGLLTRRRLPAGSLRLKSWNEFAQPGAWAMKFVFTVRDDAARRVPCALTWTEARTGTVPDEGVAAIKHERR